MDIAATASQKPILLVLIGQSNALGNNNIPTTEVGWALNHPGESWWWQGGSSYYSGSGTASSTGSTGNEFVQTAILDTDRQRCFVALSAQRRLIEEMGRSCALLHVAEGSTTLFSDWAAPPNNGAKDLFNVLDNEGTQAVAHASFPLASDYHTVFLWIQGESDASSDPQSAAYESRLNDFIDGVEAFDWVQNPTWFIFRLNAANPRTYTSVVRAAQDAVIAARSNCILFDTDGWELTDGDHYASTGYLQQGIQVASEVMIKALGGGAIPVPSYDPDAQAYFDRVEGPSGDNQSLEAEVKTAINDFVVGCKADGTWAAIKASCILAGARTLSGALQPLVGTAPTNFNFVSGDYNRKTGLVGDGSTKYLDSNRNNNADPQDSKHLALYQSSLSTADSLLFATSNLSGRSALISFVATGITQRMNSNAVASTNGNSVGFVGGVRTTSTATAARVGGTDFPDTITSQVPANENIGVFATASGAAPANARLAFYSIGESLDLALLDARVSTLMTDLDAAIEWSPSDLTSLTLWFDENDITGSPVSQWDDQAGVVGSGAYFEQSTGANQPATGTINGLAAVDFTSPSYMIGQKLAGPTNLVLSDVITASAYHVLIVAEVTSVPAGATSTIGYQLPAIVYDTLGYFYPINFRYIDATTVEVRGGHWAGSNVTVSAGNLPALNQPVLLEAWYDGTNFSIQVDGNSPGSGAAGNITSLTNRFDIGRNYTAGHYFDGLVGEILVCNAALSAGDRASARAYLANKYGITI